MPYLITTERRNPDTGKTETYYRIGDRVDGKQTTIALGFVDAKEAKRLLAVHAGNVAAGRVKKTEPPSNKRLGAYLDERVLPRARASSLAPKSVVSHETSAAHLRRLLGDAAIVDIGPSDCDRYTAKRKEEGARDRTIQLEIGTLTYAMKLAVEDRILRELPKLPRPAVRDARPWLFLTEDQCARLLVALPWDDEPASALLIYAALELGMRSGELFSRRWEDVRWKQGENGALYVGPRVDEAGQIAWETKTRKTRTVPLTAGLAVALKTWFVRLGQPEEGWLFPSPRNPGMALTTIKKGLKAACARAGVPIIHPHAMRHTWATRMAMRGVPRQITQALGGWTSPVVMERVYQHSVTEMEADAMQGASLPAPPMPTAEQPRRRKVVPMRVRSDD